jgi:hypothetical protein
MLLFLFSSICSAQMDISWSDLTDVKIIQENDEKTGQILIKPTFGPKVEKLAGKEVYISGYIIPLDLDKNEFALSQNPFYSCFFCGGAGAETMITLVFKDSPDDLKIDDFRIVRGVLGLNKEDPTKLIYIIKKAEIEII